MVESVAHLAGPFAKDVRALASAIRTGDRDQIQSAFWPCYHAREGLAYYWGMYPKEWNQAEWDALSCALSVWRWLHHRKDTMKWAEFYAYKVKGAK